MRLAEPPGLLAFRSVDQSSEQAYAGVSFVVPVKNGARWLEQAIRAVLAQDDGRALEVVIVEDGSKDESRSIALRLAENDTRIRVVDGPRRGAAAALNSGLAVARHPLIGQVDQDVVLLPGWLRELTMALASPGVAAAQGQYEGAPGASAWARVMDLDLRLRYARMRGPSVDHVCTGNSLYRADALHGVGGFDEQMGYGYDNDLSYRLCAAGFELVFCPRARSIHHWRESARDYVRQQFGVGTGRLDLVRKHRRRIGGDDVSGPWMILHAPLTLLAILALLTGGVLVLGGKAAGTAVWAGLVMLGVLATERLVCGLWATLRFRDPAGLWFPVIHLLRDLAWAVAILIWSVRRVLGRGARPQDSMKGL